MSKHLFSFELNYAGFFFNDVQFEYAERSINERLTIETEGGCLHRKNYAFFFFSEDGLTTPFCRTLYTWKDGRVNRCGRKNSLYVVKTFLMSENNSFGADNVSLSIRNVFAFFECESI